MLTGATSETVPNGSNSIGQTATSNNPTPAVSNYGTAMSSPGTDAEEPASPQRSLECSDVEQPPNNGDVMLLGGSPAHNGGQYPGLMNTFKRELQPSSPY